MLVILVMALIIWASTPENLSLGVHEQQRRRPACASAQSDHRLCYSHFGKYQIWACYRQNFDFLASLCSWWDWFESRFVGNPEDQFCWVKAHIKLFAWILFHNFEFLFSNKTIIRAGIHNMLVRIGNREDLDQTASSEAIWSGPAPFL